MWYGFSGIFTLGQIIAFKSASCETVYGTSFTQVFPAPPSLLDGADRLAAWRLVVPQAGEVSTLVQLMLHLSATAQVDP